MSGQYVWEFDDPYKLLAFQIMGKYRPADVIRMLTDDQYILSCIIKETRNVDMYGSFLDCIIEDILAHKQRMEYMHELDKLAGYYMKKLDKPRLRSELVEALKSCGIELV